MSSFENDKPNALRNVSVGRNPPMRQELTSVSSDTTPSSLDNRQAPLPPYLNSLNSRFRALTASCPPGVDNHGGLRNNLLPAGVLYPSQYGTGAYLPNAAMSPSFLPVYSPHTVGPDLNSQFFGSNTHGFDLPYPNNYYGTGGYPSNAAMSPPFLPVYSPHTVGPDLNSQFFGFDLPHPNNFYGQLEFQPSVANLYNVHGQLDSLASFGHGPQHQGVGVQAIDPGNLVNMGFYMPMPNTNLTSPGMPGSPIGVYSFPGGRSDVSSPSSRGNDNANCQKPYFFLEELKSRGRKIGLSDLSGRIVELSVYQHGSRFIQTKLATCSVEDKAAVFEEVVPHVCKLMTDVFGNYVIQKLFQYGTFDQRRNLVRTLAGQILRMSLDTHGSRVIQRALDVIELDLRIEIINGLKGHVRRCVRDQNGNHVIQKCIERIPSEIIGFIISTFRAQVFSLSIHPFGCRVIQRALEHCTDELQNQFIVDEIIEYVCDLTRTRYGNYVVQHVLKKGKPEEKTQLIKKICGEVVKLSQHKHASNVIEKCLEYGDAPSRELLITEVIAQTGGNDNLLVMMKDQYATYVVQRILEKCAESQREVLLGRIRLHLNALKKYPFGKRIVARFKKLFGEIEGPPSR